MRDIASGALKACFEKEGCVLVAYLFGSRSRGMPSRIAISI
ncbi:MAG: hypothetical protein QXQ76_04540 [Candidatus Bathyarchaeia archaeon]